MKSEALSYIEQKEGLLKFAREGNIGVEKGNYIVAGMSEKEYKKYYKQLMVVGHRTTKGRFKTIVNEYDIAQYLRWRNTGIVS